jgi:hypothetical protein
MYRFEVQLSPKLNNGRMQHYWHIFSVDTIGNRITVQNGYANTVVEAFRQANDLLPQFS